MDIISIPGLLLGIVVLIFLAYKGANTIICSIVASAVVAITSQLNFWTVLDSSYATALQSFVGGYLLLFVLGSVYGAVMEESGSAKMVAYTLLKVFGKKYSVLALILATSILNYGGVTVFVIIFAVYPFALYIFKETNTSKSFLPGLVMFAAATYTMTALPGNPTIMNLMPVPILGTDIYAGPIIGIGCTIFIFVAGYMYLQWAIKRAQAQGDGFVPAEGEIVESMDSINLKEMPSFWMAILPVLIVVVVIGLTQKIFTPNNARNTAMFLAILFIILSNWKRLGSLRNKLTIVNKGITASFTPVLATAAVVGFGGVVAASPAFPAFLEFAKNLSLQFSPYVSGSIAMSIFAGICGSSLGGTTIFYNTMIDTYLQMNINPEAFHRIMCIASCTLDSLPHCGTAITMFTVCKVTYKQGYGHFFWLTVIIPIFAVILAIAMASVGLI